MEQKMSKEEQIEEMAREICNLTVSCEECVMLAHKTGQSKERYCKAMRYAERAYNAGYRKQSEGEWEEQPRPYDDWIICSVCGEAFNVIDNCVEKFHYCPNCGAKMKGGAE